VDIEWLTVRNRTGNKGSFKARLDCPEWAPESVGAVGRGDVGGMGSKGES
jgi:hypothetical protein